MSAQRTTFQSWLIAALVLFLYLVVLPWMIS